MLTRLGSMFTKTHDFSENIYIYTHIFLQCFQRLGGNHANCCFLPVLPCLVSADLHYHSICGQEWALNLSGVSLHWTYPNFKRPKSDSTVTPEVPPQRDSESNSKLAQRRRTESFLSQFWITLGCVCESHF